MKKIKIKNTVLVLSVVVALYFFGCMVMMIGTKDINTYRIVTGSISAVYLILFNIANSDRRNKESETIEVKNENYKTVDELTKDDYLIIDMHRKQTGISGCSDEYYYNHILNYNFKTINKEA